eukprot:2876919-Rhodomonas_salina.1
MDSPNISCSVAHRQHCRLDILPTLACCFLSSWLDLVAQDSSLQGRALHRAYEVEDIRLKRNAVLPHCDCFLEVILARSGCPGQFTAGKVMIVHHSEGTCSVFSARLAQFIVVFSSFIACFHSLSCLSHFTVSFEPSSACPLSLPPQEVSRKVSERAFVSFVPGWWNPEIPFPDTPVTQF